MIFVIVFIILLQKLQKFFIMFEKNYLRKINSFMTIFFKNNNIKINSFLINC